MNSKTGPRADESDKVALIGGENLLGWHLRAFLRTRGNTEASFIGKEDFSDNRLGHRRFFVFFATAEDKSESRLEAVTAFSKAPVQFGEGATIVLVSSQTGSKEYIKRKDECRKILASLALKKGVAFRTLVVPAVFGEYDYSHDSPVRDLFAGIARNVNPKTPPNTSVGLVHAQEVAQAVYRILTEKKPKNFVLRGTKMRYKDLASFLSRMMQDYNSNIFPEVRTPFTRALFNTLRSRLIEEGGYFPRSFDVKSDNRGFLFESVRHFSQDGQSFISLTKPGAVRGNHYHTRKFERFAVLHGRATISLRKIYSDKVIEFNVSGDKPSYIDMPPFYAHNIKNTGDGDLVTFFWSNEVFNPDDTDTYVELV